MSNAQNYPAILGPVKRRVGRQRPKRATLYLAATLLAAAAFFGGLLQAFGPPWDLILFARRVKHNV